MIRGKSFRVEKIVLRVEVLGRMFFVEYSTVNAEPPNFNTQLPSPQLSSKYTRFTRCEIPVMIS